MNVIRYLILVVSFGAAGIGLAQGARETSGMQAAPLTVIDDAHQQFQRGNLQESAKDLRSAAALLRIEGRRYPAADAALIDGSAAGLDGLASGIEDKSIKTIDQFKNAAIAAVVPKAKVHHAAALKAWSARERARTGEEILAASHALEHGLKWVDGAVSKAASELLASAETTADALTRGKSVTDTEVSRVIDAIGSEIEALNKRTATPKATH